MCEQRKLTLLLSPEVLNEYRDVLLGPDIGARFTQFDQRHVELLLKGLRYRAEFMRRVAVTFRFDRDHLDEKIIELAIAGSADWIVTGDKDLLSLPTSRSDAGKRFRQRLRNVQVGTVAQFVAAYPELFKA